MSGTIGVLFVCLGNICRSPLAEGVLRELATRERVAARLDVDSAGTSAFHTGDSPDPRTLEVALRRGVRLEHAARQVTEIDLRRFDYIIAMDANNLEKIERLAEYAGGGAEVHLLREFDETAVGARDVPDPYFGGERGFEDVHDMVERACEGLLRHIREQRDF
ncbi:MAG: low molecular weight protein-tyrosine-phosphatase [Gemmatimonadota bacterium]